MTTTEDFRLGFPSHNVRDALDRAYDSWGSGRGTNIRSPGLAKLTELLPVFEAYGQEVVVAARSNDDLDQHSRLVQDALTQWRETLQTENAGEFVTLLAKIKNSELELYR